MRDILLIDDDAEILQSLAKALSSYLGGLSLCAAGNAAEGLRLLEAEKPHVVVLDLCLDPRAGTESGFSVLRAIRARDPHALGLRAGFRCCEKFVRGIRTRE